MSFSLSGLPPLPKSLSGLLNIAGSELFFFGLVLIGLGELLVTKYFLQRRLFIATRERPVLPSPPPAPHGPAELVVVVRERHVDQLVLGVQSPIQGQPQLPT